MIERGSSTYLVVVVDVLCNYSSSPSSLLKESIRRNGCGCRGGELEWLMRRWQGLLSNAS